MFAILWAAKGSAFMRAIEIRIEQASFADTLAAMREWLDREKCNLLHFSHTSNADGTIVISAGFPGADNTHAEAFHRQFGGEG
jgi:hypothetical protein